MAKRKKKYNGIRTITPGPKKIEKASSFSPSELSVYEVVDFLNTNTDKGLTTQNVQKRRKKDGMNLLYSEFKLTFSSAFADHLKSVISVLFAGSLFLFYAFYRNNFYLFTAIVITCSILSDCIIEHVASLKFEKVRKHSSLKAVVKRNGKVYVTDSRYLVPGDLVFLRKGAIVPADLRLYDSNGLVVMETPVTGSDLYIKKIAKDIGENEKGTFVNMAFAGSIVTDGNAWGIVCFTGAKTKLRNASKGKNGNVPAIFKYVYSVSSMLSITSAFLGMVWILFSMIFTSSLTNSYIFATAVAACYFGDTLVSLTAFSFSLGLSEMRKKGAILRNLSSVESLAFTDSLLVSQNTVFPVLKTEIENVYIGLNSIDDSEEELEILKYFLICSDVRKVSKNEKNKSFKFEGKQNAVAVATYAQNKGFSPDDLSKEFLITETYNHETDDYFSALAFDGDKKTLFIKGSPSEILPLCKYHQTVYGIKTMSENDYENYRTFSSSHTNDAGYLIAIAKVETEIDKISDYNDNKILTLCGMIKFTTYFGIDFFNDVSKCHNAGINVAMLSSDAYMRAYNLGKNSGIFSKNEQVITAEEMQYISDSEFAETYSKYKLFMNFPPKLCNEIVTLNKRDNKCIAVSAESTDDLVMMKNADVSFVKDGESSDMIKQSSDVIISKGGFDIINNVICSAKKIYRRVYTLCDYAVYNYVSVFLICFLSSLFNIGLRVYDFIIASFVFSAIIALYISVTSVPDKRRFDNPVKRKKGVVPKRFISSIIQGIECSLICLLICLLSGNNCPIAFIVTFSSFSLFTAIYTLNERKLQLKGIIGINYMFFIALAIMILIVICLCYVPLFSVGFGYIISSPFILSLSVIVPLAIVFLNSVLLQKKTEIFFK